MVLIKSLDNDSTKAFITGINESVFQLSPGSYKIEISTMHYDVLNFPFTIEPNEYININAKLGLGPETVVYQINSKEKLVEKEISEIIECVKVNRLHSDKKDCSDKRRFRISMQI